MVRNPRYAFPFPSGGSLLFRNTEKGKPPTAPPKLTYCGWTKFPAPPKKPRKDLIPHVNTKKQWFLLVSKWCEMDFVFRTAGPRTEHSLAQLPANVRHGIFPLGACKQDMAWHVGACVHQMFAAFSCYRTVSGLLFIEQLLLI